VRGDEGERLAPSPAGLVDTVQYTRAGTPGRPVIEATPEDVEGWLTNAAEQLAATDDEPTWRTVELLDVRRSWAAVLLWTHGVAPLWVKTAGGWEWAPFAATFLGELTTAGRNRERAKIDGGGAAVDTNADAHTPLVAPPSAVQQAVYGVE
jgi:hypothetical protein